jgi:hypothetical protein
MAHGVETATVLAVIEGGEEQERTGQAPECGLTERQFCGFLSECRYQPPWRAMADKCADYQDGNQLDQETLEALQKKGMGPLQRNIIQPLVNVVLGFEAKTRSDWRVVADDDSVQEVAEALSAKLHEAERETRADRACSDAYKPQVIAGLGWVEVSRTSDPFAYPYHVGYVHRREIWWDWRDETPDLAKARFLIRKRWFDVDQAVAYFPEHRELLHASVGDPHRYEMIVAKRGLELGMSLDEARDVDIEDYEQWRSYDRKRICLYEVWYRNFVRGYVAPMPNGDVVELDLKNPVHVALISRGIIQPKMAVYSKTRMAIFAGPHKLMDAPWPKRYFPYVPFWGYREDRTGVPYGMVRAMLSPQDEVNARLQKMMWLLGAKRVQMDSDALDTEMQSPQDLLAELSRVDAVIFRNPHRINKGSKIDVDDNLSLADAQFKVLQDAMQAAQQVVGVFNAMLGRESAATSGIAINSLVEQGLTALAEINDNYRFARRLVGERLLDLIRDDMIGRQVDVLVGEPGKKRVISLNKPVQTQDAGKVVQMVQNDVRSARLKVALDDVPSTASYRQQQFTMLAELTKGLPPQLQAVITPFVIEASDLRKRREIADTLRKAMGQATPRTPEEERQAELAQAQAMQFMQEMQRRQAMAEIAEREAKVEKLRAEAEKARAEIAADPVLEKFKAEAERRISEVERRAKERIDQLLAEKAELRMSSAQREAKLIAELNRLKSAAQTHEAEMRRAEIEREIEQIERSRQDDTTRIESDSAHVIEVMGEEIAKLREELLDQLRSEIQRAVGQQARA